MGKTPIDPPPPALWDTLLAEWGLSEAEALTSQRVREFVRHNYRTRFIPEKVLNAHGCLEKEEF